MVLLNWFIFTLILFALMVHLDAKICPKGHRVVKGGCAICPPEFYQPVDNELNRCIICSRCDEESGSSISRECTNVRNRECKCRKGFVASDTDSSTCKCDRGFGKKHTECLKCEVGFFNDQIDSPCKEWRKCNSGVNKTGTDTSDNICNKESKTHVTATTTSNKITSLNKHEAAETLRKHNKSTTITVTAESAPGQRDNPVGKVNPFQPSSADSHTGVILITCLIALLILTAVICKLYISPCPRQRKPAVQTQDSLCRRPVEESGDDSQSSLKQNSEEP